MEGFTEQDLGNHAPYIPPPPAEYLDGMGVVSRDTYNQIYTYQVIAGSAYDNAYKDRYLMRGTKHCLKARYAWGYSCTWGGFAVKFTERYLRRYYPKEVFFNHDQLWPILEKVRDRYWMAARTFQAYEDHFARIGDGPCSRRNDNFSVIFKGKTLSMGYEQYKMALLIFKQTKQLEKLEKMKNEQINKN